MGWWHTQSFAIENSRRKALLGIKWYVRTLEQVVIDLIKEWGGVRTRSPQTGVWLGKRKICAMGGAQIKHDDKS